MKTSRKQNLKSRTRRWVPAVLIVAALLFSVMPMRAHDDDDDGRDKDRHGDKPEIVDPDDRYRGKTYGEWAAAMLQWVFSIPTDQNPITDTTGAFADVGQSGPVFFLPSNLGGTTVREVTVPEGKALFIGILSYVWVQFPDDPIYTIDELREIAAPFVDNPRLLACEIDGKPVRHLLRYRVQSPVFSVTVPAGNLLELDPGTYAPCVDDGYYLMLEPLEAGRHTIHFAAQSNDGTFSLDVTYHIEVVEPTEIVRPDRRYFGKTYGQWAAAWWQWALSVPAVQSPLTDPTGEFAGVGQSGPVWFLAGTLGNSAQRMVTVPAGKPIFMPVHNWIFGSGVFDCDPTVPGVTCDVAELRSKAAAAATGAEVVEAWIDGEKVRHIRSYRGISPEPFSITLPNDPVIDVPAGTYYPQVADGYWLMLTPPDKGRHTIRVRVVNSAFGIDQYFGIELNVIKPGRVVPPNQRYHGRTYAEWSAKLWEWYLEIPVDDPNHPHPQFAEDYDVAAFQRFDDVWFVTGAASEITMTVPSDKALIFWPVAAEASSLEAPPYFGITEAEQRDAARFYVDHSSNVFCTIDGVPVGPVSAYRVSSPQFRFDAPTPWIFGDVGGRGTATADGYYFLVEPLSKGEHTVRIGGEFHTAAGEFPDFGPDPVDLSFETIYHVKVR